MNEWLNDIAREMRDSNTAIRKIGDELSYLQIGWRPPTGGWSIAQVIEHLILTDTPYVDDISRALAQAPRAGRPWKASMMGGFVTRAVEPKAPRKIKTGRAFQPGPEPRADPVGDYLALREQIIKLVEQANDVDLNRVRLSSPIMKLIRYNLGDAFMILTRHTQRHLQQIERIRNHRGFPAS